LKYFKIYENFSRQKMQNLKKEEDHVKINANVIKVRMKDKRKVKRTNIVEIVMKGIVKSVNQKIKREKRSGKKEIKKKIETVKRKKRKIVVLVIKKMMQVKSEQDGILVAVVEKLKKMIMKMKLKLKKNHRQKVHRKKMMIVKGINEMLLKLKMVKMTDWLVQVKKLVVNVHLEG
jgi:hypothetical protein